MSLVSYCELFMFLLPLGPLNSLISTTVSKMGRLLRTYSRTIDPASLSASTALLWETSDTSTSFTRKIQSLTLKKMKMGKSQACPREFLKEYYDHLTWRCGEAKHIGNLNIFIFGRNTAYEGNKENPETLSLPSLLNTDHATGQVLSWTPVHSDCDHITYGVVT